MQEAIDKGRAKEETGANASRNSLQIISLLDTLEEHKVDAAMGGARRDEEKARAKERFFLIEMSSVSGIQKINALNYGIYLMDVSIMASTLEFSYFQLDRDGCLGIH